MSSSNPQPLISSWSLSSKYNNGPRISDRLIPPNYKRISTLHTNVWRESRCSDTLNWGSSNWSYLFPQSLQVVSSCFLRISLPAVTDANYKKNVGLECVQSMRLLSAGNVVYQIDDVKLLLRDYLESLTNEEFQCFSDSYLGGASESNSARDVYIPIFLPNSAFALRHGKSTRGLGVFPAETQDVRTEIQITMYPNNQQLTDPTKATPNINAGECSICVREVKMTEANERQYKNHSGSYSVVGRRMTDLCDFRTAEAGEKVALFFNQPQGSVTEFQVIALPFQAEETDRDYLNTVLPTKMKLTCDSIVVKDLDRRSKIKLHNYQNGFIHGQYVKQVARFCFGAHTSENSHMYTGAFNFSNISQVKVDLEFDAKVTFKIVAVQLQTTSINSNGVLESVLE